MATIHGLSAVLKYWNISSSDTLGEEISPISRFQLGCPIASSVIPVLRELTICINRSQVLRPFDLSTESMVRPNVYVNSANDFVA